MPCSITLRLLFVFVFVQTNLSVFTQTTSDSLRVDSLKKVLLTQKEDTNKVNTLNELSKNLFKSKLYENALQYANDALSLAGKIDFQEGKGKAAFLIGSIYRQQKDYSESVKKYLEAINIFRETGDKQQLGNTHLEVANVFYYELQNYPEALKNCFTALKFFEELNDNVQTAFGLRLLSLINTAQGEDTTALKNLLWSLKTFETVRDSINIAYTYNVIASLYSDQGKYEEALHDCSIALKYYEALGSRGPGYGIAWTYGEIGETYEDWGEKILMEGNKFAASEKLLQALKYGAERLQLEHDGNMPSESSYLDLGNIYMQLSKISSPVDKTKLLLAKSYLEKGVQSTIITGRRDVLKLTYQSLSKADSMLGNYKQAFEYYKLYILYRDSLVNEEATKKSLQLKMQYESDKKDAAAKAEIQQRNLIIMAILFSATIALLVINRQRLKSKYRRQIAEQDKQRVEQEMESARAELKMFTQNIIEKTNLIEKLELQVKAHEYNTDEHQIIEELSHQTILTEDDWLKFKTLFEKTHPRFFAKLKEKANDITLAEQRMAALTRLHLTTKQMAALLGISPNSVIKTKQRLRQRFNFETDFHVEEFLSRL